MTATGPVDTIRSGTDPATPPRLIALAKNRSASCLRVTRLALPWRRIRKGAHRLGQLRATVSVTSKRRPSRPRRVKNVWLLTLHIARDRLRYDRTKGSHIAAVAPTPGQQPNPCQVRRGMIVDSFWWSAGPVRIHWRRPDRHPSKDAMTDPARQPVAGALLMRHPRITESGMLLVVCARAACGASASPRHFVLVTA